MGVFSKNNQPDTDLKRNAFDGSFQNNLTMKMGYLYPCFCKEVIPGDTFRVNAAFGLRFMPTAFPLQTKIKAHIDFFYVRNRNLWDKWNNYFTQIGPHDGFPLLSDSEKIEQFKTGSLGDYLGLPSTIVGDGNLFGRAVNFLPEYDRSPYGYRLQFYMPGQSVLTTLSQEDVQTSPKFVCLTDSISLNRYDSDSPAGYRGLYQDLPTFNDGEKSYTLIFTCTSEISRYFDGRGNKHIYLHHTQNNTGTFADNVFGNIVPISYNSSDFHFERDESSGLTKVYIRSVLAQGTNPFFSLLMLSYTYGANNVKQYTVEDLPFALDLFPGTDETPPYYYVKDALVPINVFTTNSSDVKEATELINEIPIDINALPFRAYEQIYNSFYRDDRNNPLYVNGVFDPNRFLPNTNGGIDSTPYRLHKRNWEQDFLTTALPSPQFGQAPLVGLSSSGVAEFRDNEGNVISSQLSTDNDGDTVIGFTTTNSSSVNNTLIKLASTGISINDLRGVNALQRYLETKQRIGLRYRDQIKAHFGIEIKQDILDMPEFIGSISQNVDVNQINQTSESNGDPLGSYAGQLSCVGGRENGFQKYCDENGYIIGIISVVPVPSYSQLLPKHFLKTHEPLDYYNPAFAHLGFQPIKYSEVCPLQAINNETSLNTTFGYQRAWYDYISSTDEIHGDFRTTLNSFILTRVFNKLPTLSPDFLTVDPDSMNNVFTVNQVDGKPIDTILGQIHFDVTMMRPISRFGVPRLE